jgi:hypothetical protein
MAYFQVRILSATPGTNDDGESVVRIAAQEIQPRTFNINAKNLDAARITELTKAVDRVVMLPVREGRLRDGTPFFQLLPDQIIDLPSVPAASAEPTKPVSLMSKTG